ncbi:MAG: phosphoribosylanthranilate isomerase [Solirubrobacteraceae bacterium MAG38_C4-C5]|nr:phosphoribosylanthranilate isomerase [Candidatus Siliceabacter maunaloa]
MDAPRIKLCGITSLQDAELCADAGAWALGMIFWSGSRRRCTVPAAEEIGALLRRRVELAGVFVNAPLDTVARTAERARLSLVQLHGDEGPAFCDEVARRTGARVLKAARIANRGDLQALRVFHTDFHLVDAHVEGLRGGTGETLDWSMLAARRRGGTPLVLSGGLTPENVAGAVEAVAPWAVDSASGTEAAPGRKDPERVEAFVAAVRSTATPEPENVGGPASGSHGDGLRHPSEAEAAS